MKLNGYIGIMILIIVSMAWPSKAMEVELSQEELRKVIKEKTAVQVYEEFLMEGVSQENVGPEKFKKEFKKYIDALLEGEPSIKQGVHLLHDVLIPAFILVIGKMVSGKTPEMKEHQNVDAFKKLDIVVEYIQSEYGDKIKEKQEEYLNDLRNYIQDYISKGVLPEKKEEEYGFEWLYGKEAAEEQGRAPEAPQEPTVPKPSANLSSLLKDLQEKLTELNTQLRAH